MAAIKAEVVSNKEMVFSSEGDEMYVNMDQMDEKEGGI